MLSIRLPKCVAGGYFRWCSGATPLCAIRPVPLRFSRPRRICSECSGRVGGWRSWSRWGGTPRAAAPLLGSRSLRTVGTFQLLWRTPECTRLAHQVARPARAGPDKCLLALFRSHSSAILVSERILEHTITRQWNSTLSVVSST